MTGPRPGAPGWLTRLADVVTVADPDSLAPDPQRRDGEQVLRKSAVLILFGEGERGPDVLLQQRSDDLRHHAGQPAFPGGGIDPTDAGPVDAALREAVEEVGLDPTGVDVLATLPELWIPPSANLVTPVLAWWRVPSRVQAVDPVEVAAVARVPIADLANPANRVMVKHPMGYSSPAFQVAGMLVWGFTGGVLDRLVRLGGWEQDWDREVVVPFPVIVGTS